MNHVYQSSAYLVGYYGMQNSGDDALMTASIYGARKWLNIDQLKVSSPRELQLFDGQRFAACHVDQQKYPGQNRLKSYLRAAESKRIIFGGGSVFHNARDINLKRDLMMLSGGRSHIALGVGLGPFVNTKAERACAKFLNECAFTGLRDPLSFDIAKTIAPNANVKQTFDLAPQLLSIDGFKLQSVRRQGIAVCLCPKERLSGEQEIESKRLKRLARALEMIQSVTQEPIVFLDFNGHSELGDRQVHEELASYLAPTCVFSFVKYDANPLRVIQRMATYKLAISMRLHASVFGFLSETPVLSLNYHSKCDQWCEQIGQPFEQRVDLDDFDISNIVNAVCNGLSEGFHLPTLSVSEALSLSMNNWRMSYDYENETTVQRCHPAL